MAGERASYHSAFCLLSPGADMNDLKELGKNKKQKTNAWAVFPFSFGNMARPRHFLTLAKNWN
jgi:hypothetical protein